jgi:hypothetical protein
MQVGARAGNVEREQADFDVPEARVCGAGLRVSFDSIVQFPSAGCTRMFRAVFVVPARSPVSGVIVSDPPPTCSVAGSCLIRIHCRPTSLPLNSSLAAGWAKYTVYVVVTPSGPVTAIVPVPGLPSAA